MSRILLLEDDDALIDGLQYALRKRGYEIVAARSVGEAKKCLRQGFDLLLLDVSLPDGTGFEVCENIRESGDGTPVIFLTAADDEMSVVRGLDGGGGGGQYRHAQNKRQEQGQNAGAFGSHLGFHYGLSFFLSGQTVAAVPAVLNGYLPLGVVLPFPAPAGVPVETTKAAQGMVIPTPPITHANAISPLEN